MKKVSSAILYLFVGVVGFVLFLYLSFPYEVLKEALLFRASNQSGVSIRIEELNPVFPLGMYAKNVTINSDAKESDRFKLNSLSAYISFLQLFFGNLQIEASGVDLERGSVKVKTRFGLFSLLSSKGIPIPTYVGVNATRFSIGPVVDFAVSQTSLNSDAGLLLKPLLESLDLDGKLDGKVGLSIDSKLSRSKGSMKLELQELVLKSYDQNLDFPDQSFKKALVEATLSGGLLKVKETTGFVSQDLDIGCNGTISQKVPLSGSIVDLNVSLKLGKPLQEHFLLLLDAATGRDTGGKISLKLTGEISPHPSIELL